MFQGKKLLFGVMAVCLLTVFTGCNSKGKSTAGSSVQQASAVSEPETSGSESAEKPVLDETETAQKNEHENINKDMEDMDAMDIVKDMRIGWNIGNTLDSIRTDIARIEQPFKFETA